MHVPLRQVYARPRTPQSFALFFFLLAAHKTLPSTGAGAVNTMQDTVILDNRIYDIVPNNFDTVKGVLEYFKSQPFDLIKLQ